MGTRAATLSDAGKNGRCMALCEGLGFTDFSVAGLRRLVDLRPSLGSGEYVYLVLANPFLFLVASRDTAYLSPVVEQVETGAVLWAFEPEADKFKLNPEIVDMEDIRIIPTRVLEEHEASKDF
jgi:hypothetical protein